MSKFARVLIQGGARAEARQVARLSLANLVGYLIMLSLAQVIFHFDFNLPDLLYLLAISLTAGTTTAVLIFRAAEKYLKLTSASPSLATSKQDTTPSGSSGRVLRLVRKAERLDEVEKDLILRMSHSDRIDVNTKRLLAEMSVCTNQLIGQLSELNRESKPDSAQKN